MTLRFALPHAAELRPFAIVGPTGSETLSGGDLRLVDALDETHTAFCEAMNRANCMAYDGTTQPGNTPTALGMPRWVMLDCCILPGAVFGFETRREHLPAPLADALDPGRELEWIGVSEYIAMPTVRPGEVVGASLFSLVFGQRLGTRTKAMALRVLGSHRQIGVTQWASPGVKLHLGFGPLRVVSPHVAIHNRAHETFVYEVDVPDEALLRRIEEGETLSWDVGGGELVECDPRTDDVSDLVAGRGGQAWLVAAGPAVDGRVSSLTLRFDD